MMGTILTLPNTLMIATTTPPTDFSITDLLQSNAIDLLGYLITVLVTAAAYKLVAWFKTRAESKPVNVARSMQSDQAVNDLLHQLRDDTTAGRAFVLRFHNGSDFFDGSPMKRLSCTHEVVAQGVSREIQRQQGVPISMFVPGIDQVLENDPKIRFVDKLPDSHFRAFKEQMCVVAYHLVPLYKDGRLLSGVLAIHYCDMKFLDNEPTNRMAEEALHKYSRLLELEFARHG